MDKIKCEKCGKDTTLWITYETFSVTTKYFGEERFIDDDYPNGVLRKEVKAEKIYLCEDEHETTIKEPKTDIQF